MNLPQVEFTSPAEWNPDLHDDNQTPDEMIRQFPAVPHDATSEFYNLTGNMNYEHLRSVKTAGIAVDNDDKIVNPECLIYNHANMRIQVVMMIATMIRNLPRRQQQCNGNF
jgi:hypothetical protein